MKFIFKILFFPLRLIFKHPFLAITGVLGFLGWKRFKENEEKDLEEFETWEPPEQNQEAEGTGENATSPANAKPQEDPSEQDENKGA